MIFSEKLMAFIKANTPQKKMFPIPEMVEGLSKKEDGDKIIFTRWESGTVYASVFFPKGKEIEVEWRLKLEVQKDPKKIIFEPKIYEKGGEPRGTMADPVEFILKQLGVKEAEIESPEPMVQLPIPSWMGHEYYGGGDWPNQEMASKICFISEAKQMISEFETELGKVKEELK